MPENPIVPHPASKPTDQTGPRPNANAGAKRNSPRPPQRNNQRPGGKKQGANQNQHREHHRPHEDPLTTQILDVAREISLKLGSTLPEAFYREALREEMARRGINLRVRPHGVVRHRDRAGAEFAADFLCNGELLVNVRCGGTEFSHAQISELSGAQRFFNTRGALLIDFFHSEPHHKRLTQANDPFPSISQEDFAKGAPSDAGEQMKGIMLCRSVLRIGRAHGLGFDAAAYRALLKAELAAENLDFREAPAAAIRYGDQVLGELLPEGLIEVQRSGLVMTTALREGIRKTDCATLELWLKALRLPWGLLLHFGKRRFEWQWAGKAVPR